MSPISETYVAHHQRLVEELTNLAEGKSPYWDATNEDILFSEVLKTLLAITLRLELYVVENFEGELKKTL